MADATDSTPAPSRRAFLTHAALSGVAATRPPIFQVPEVADAAILAMKTWIIGLIAASDRAHRDATAAQELVYEMCGPIPVKPRDIQLYPTDAAYHAAKRRYDEECTIVSTRRAKIEKATNWAALEEAADDAESAVVNACSSLAEMRATTLDGLILKAQFAERGNWDDLSRSIVNDLLAMA